MLRDDLGLFDDPDSFYRVHNQRFGLIREMLYRYAVRQWMNARVRGIRRGRASTYGAPIRAKAEAE